MTLLRTHLLALLVVIGCALAAVAAPSSVGERVSLATEAFRVAADTEGLEDRRAAFRAAAQRYDDALAAGHVNGALEYNAANAWLLGGDLGRAILHYRRALLLRPADPQIQANLQTARTRRRDQIDESAGRAVAETIFFWHRGLGYRTKLWLALIAWALACALLAATVVLRARGRPIGPCWRAAAAAFVVALAVGVSFLVEAAERGARDAGVVVAQSIELRTGDGESYPARYENPIHAGVEVTVREERAGWTLIELPDGKDGWVPSESVERI